MSASEGKNMGSYTVMIVPDSSGSVRRYRVSGRRARHAMIAGGIVALLVVGLAVDWARARLDASELAELRARNVEQQTQLEGLSGAVGLLESRLSRVSELERKVRVIADLPAPAQRTVAPPAGVGGEAETEPLPKLSPEEADLPPAARPDEKTEPPAPISSLDPEARAVRVASLQARARHLAGMAEQREQSLDGLVDGLRGKSRRLASTPSIWPTKGWVTSRYGHRTSPFTGNRQFHAGVDVAGRAGTDVVAPARGRVVFAGSNGPLGNTIILDHGYGVRTTFGHNQKVSVKRGQEVQRGEAIASLGSTGRSTGPHLHYAVQVDGRRVDPMNYILDE
jgi:hypothetical protein